MCLTVCQDDGFIPYSQRIREFFERHPGASKPFEACHGSCYMCCMHLRWPGQLQPRLPALTFRIPPLLLPSLQMHPTRSDCGSAECPVLIWDWLDCIKIAIGPSIFLPLCEVTQLQSTVLLKCTFVHISFKWFQTQVHACLRISTYYERIVMHCLSRIMCIHMLWVANLKKLPSSGVHWRAESFSGPPWIHEGKWLCACRDPVPPKTKR